MTKTIINVFVCFHAGGLRSRIYLTRIPRSLCRQTGLLCSLAALTTSQQDTPLCPAPQAPASSSSSSPGTAPVGTLSSSSPAPVPAGASNGATAPHSSSAGLAPRQEVRRPGGGRGQHGQDSYRPPHPPDSGSSQCQSHRLWEPCDTQ